MSDARSSPVRAHQRPTGDVLLAPAASQEALVDRLLAWRIAWAIAAALIAIVIARGAFGGVPHVQDEVVYTWQAERLTELRLSVAEPEPRAASMYHFFNDENGRRYGIFPNGWPAVLALGVWLGWPIVVNPLLLGLSVWLGTELAFQHASRRAAFLAAPLLALSPQALLQGASRMSHTLVGLLFIAVLLALGRPGARVTGRRALLIGGAIGWIALSRPLDAVVIATVVGVVALRRRMSLFAIAAMAPPLVAAAGLTLVQNVTLTGEALLFPQTKYFETMPPPSASPNFTYGPGCNALGFGPDRGCLYNRDHSGHTPAKAWRNFRYNWELVKSLWLGTPWSLLLVPLALALPRTRMLAIYSVGIFSAFALAYGLYWYHGVCLGARFLHPAIIPTILCVSAGAAELTRRLRVPAAAALVLVVPAALTATSALPELGQYWYVDSRFQELQDHWRDGPALVFVAYSPETHVVEQPVTALNRLFGPAPDLMRGSWFASRGPLEIVEYYPELVDSIRDRHPGKPAFLYLMSASREHDLIRPISPADGAANQRKDLPLPRSPALYIALSDSKTP